MNKKLGVVFHSPRAEKKIRINMQIVLAIVMLISIIAAAVTVQPAYAATTRKAGLIEDGLKQRIQDIKPAPKKPTATVKPAATVTPTPTAAPTKTLQSSNKGKQTKTATPTPTGLPTMTAAPTMTLVPTATIAPTDIATATMEPTATIVPTDTQTATMEPTATVVPTDTPMATVVPTDTPTATMEPTATAIPPVTVPINFKVSQTGIQRVTYEMLKSTGLDLVGVADAQIGLSNRGQSVPVYIESQSGTFGPGGFIEFYGEALNTIYTDNNIYTLQVGGLVGSRMPVVDAAPAAGLAPSAFSETMTVNNQRAFTNSAPGSDAWYDTSMTVNTTSKSWSYAFQVDGLADASAAASLKLVVWGATDWPQNPDHHLKVSVNGLSLADVTFDGLVGKTIPLSLPAGTLVEGTNNFILTMPGDTGVAGDVIDLDKYTLTYLREFQASGGRLNFTAAANVFHVTDLPSANVVIYRMDTEGPVRLENVEIQGSGSSYIASFAGMSQTSKYMVTAVEAMYTPMLEAARDQADLNQPAEFLIIANPDFIKGLQPLVEARQAQGLSVSVVDVSDLYTKYTYGIFDPQAIKDYIAYAYSNLGTQAVLLVGGDTYDYRNYLGTNSLSFIPSLYTSTGPAARFVPADPLYADVNGDDLPDLAIGRFPVRSTAELNLMVNKTLEYAGKDYGRTAVFASDLNDGVSYKDISNSLAAGLPAGWTSQNIHMDDVDLSTARTQLLSAMNAGTALITYTGHGDPGTWTFSGLFTNNDAAALTNVGRPFVVVQWACWTTYYVDPVNDYLVQKLLFSGEQGAAAVLGATTLLNSTSLQRIGTLLTPRLVTPGMSIGQALQDAKIELALTHPEYKDVLLGWTLMGDPTLVIQP